MNRATRTTLIFTALAVLAPSAMALASGLARAPQVTLADLQGNRVKVDYKTGKLTLVNFWATWCGPCREEMPQIARLIDKYGKEGFKAIGIAVQSGDPGDVKAFLTENKDFGINYPILIGDDDTLTRFGDVQAVPTTYLIDPTGKVVQRFIGVTPGFAVKLEGEVKRAVSPPSDPKKP